MPTSTNIEVPIDIYANDDYYRNLVNVYRKVLSRVGIIRIGWISTYLIALPKLDPLIGGVDAEGPASARRADGIRVPIGTAGR